MSTRNRRTFLKQASTGLAGAAVLTHTASTRAAGANDRIVIGAIGCGGQGRSLIERFSGAQGVELAYVCDPDAGRAAKGAKAARDHHPKVVSDLRRILDDKSVDAVTIGTPDHWHAPAAILACQAGKHVYVEKPCSHNIREGRLLVEAARRNKRVVQHGTQSRSAPLIAHGIQLLRQGIIGDVLVAKAWDVQRRGSIGHASPSSPPAGVDYDLWVGPAPFVPFQKNRFHYDWHWWYAFGTGDMGNDGVHEMDIARWGLGVETHPTTVAAIGGKYAYDDDQQFPDTQYVSYEYPGDGSVGQRRQLVFELRLWSRYGLDEGIDNGNAFYGTKGWMLLSKRGILKVFDERNRPVEIPGTPPSMANHQQNFLDAIRTGQPPTAEIAVGHLSATLCHLGNIAARLGRSLNFDPKTERILGDEQANALVKRNYRDHWAAPQHV